MFVSVENMGNLSHDQRILGNALQDKDKRTAKPFLQCMQTKKHCRTDISSPCQETTVQMRILCRAWMQCWFCLQVNCSSLQPPRGGKSMPMAPKPFGMRMKKKARLFSACTKMTVALPMSQQPKQAIFSDPNQWHSIEVKHDTGVHEHAHKRLNARAQSSMWHQLHILVFQLRVIYEDNKACRNAWHPTEC